MGRDTYFTYEEEYDAYVNRQRNLKKPVLSYEDWIKRFIKLSYPFDVFQEERYEETIKRHNEILSTAKTGKF